MTLEFYKKRYFLPFGIIALGCILRLTHLVAPHIDSDQAIFGLQGMHVLKGEFPVFSWGYAYIGTLQSYIDAIFFYLFGPSRQVLNLIPLFFYIGFSLSLYRLSVLLFPSSAFSLLPLLFASVSPDFFIIHGIWGRHGYPETFCFGTMILTICCISIYKKQSLKMYFFLFLISGLAFWTNFLIIYYFIPLSVFMLYTFWINKNWTFRWRLLMASIVGFFSGSLPFWIYNFKHGFPSFNMFQSASPSGKTLLESIDYTFHILFPVLVGAKQHATGVCVPGFHIFLTLLSGFFIIFFTFYGAFFFLKRPRLSPWGIIWIFSISLIVIFFKSSYSRMDESGIVRYLIPFYSIYPLLPVFFLSVYFKEIHKPASLIITSFILFMNLASFWFGSPLFQKEIRDKTVNEIESEKKLFKELNKTENKHYLLYEYWDAARYTFDAKEEIIFSHVNTRYPPYLYSMMELPTLTYLLGGKDGRFIRGLDSLGYDFTVKKLNRYYSFSSFQPKWQMNPSSLSASSFSLSSDLNPKATTYLLDGNYNTSYLIKPRKNKPHTIVANFKQKRPLTGICIVLKDRFYMPSEWTIKNEDGKMIKEMKDYLPGYLLGRHPYIPYAPYMIEVFFPPIDTEKIEIEFQKSVPVDSFEITELLLFEQTPPFKNNSKDFYSTLNDTRDISEIYSGIASHDKLKSIFPDAVIKTGYFEPERLSLESQPLLIFENSYLSYNLKKMDELNIPYEFAYNEMFAFIRPLQKSWKNAIWNGKMILSFFDKKKANTCFVKSQKMKSHNFEKELELIEKTVFYLPKHYWGLLLLLDHYKNTPRFQDYWKLFKKLYYPNTPQKADFRNGMTYKGHHVSHTKISPKDTFSITYFILINKKMKNSDAVFVHFLTPEGNLLFQNDHFLDTKEEYFIAGEMVCDQNIVLVPASLTYKGKIEIWFGIWDPEERKRYKVATSLPQQHRSVKIGEIEIL